MTDVIKLNWPANKIKNPVLSKMWPAEPQEPQDKSRRSPCKIYFLVDHNLHSCALYRLDKGKIS